MNSLYQFMADSPVLTFFLACILVAGITSVLSALANLIARVIRCINILARGWPPPHLDADGDWRPAPRTDA